jgi:DNA-binding CsgD family transcriptional regulator
MESSKSTKTDAARIVGRRVELAGAGATGRLPSPSPSSTHPAGHHEQDASGTYAHVCVEFEVDDEKCRIVCLDKAGFNGARARLSTAANGSPASEELARFDVAGLSYALLIPATPRAQRAARREAEAAARTDFLGLLTQRELQIVRLICAGCLNQQVAERLQISEYTVGSHLKNVYVKLGLRSRGELLFRCAQALARAAGNGVASRA